MFLWYYGMTAKADIPVWAHGLQWYISDDADAQLDSWPTDFGILMDFANVTRARRGCGKPFVWAKDLENRLYQRWKKRPTPPFPFLHNDLPLPECMRDRRIVRSPSRPPPAKIRQESVDGIDQPTKVCIVEGKKDRRVVRSPPRPPPEKSRRMYSPERPRLEKRRRLSSDGIDQPANVSIVGGVKDWRVVHSPPRPPSEKSRRMYSHAACAPVTPAWQDLVDEAEILSDWIKSILGDLVEEDPMDAPEFYGFCGGGAWIPNTPEPGYRPISTSPHRASSSSRMHVSTHRDVVCAEASSSFLPPDAMAYSTVPVWSSVCSLIGSGAPEVD